MADNYLEKRYEEVFSGKSQGKTTPRPSLDSLLTKNHSHFQFDSSYQIHPRQLDSILSVNAKILSPSSPLRFRGICTPEENLIVHTEAPCEEMIPTAYVVIGAKSEYPRQDIDLGICAQSMMLKALELGLAGVVLTSFRAEALREKLHLPLRPLLILAFGKVQQCTTNELADLETWKF